MFQFFATSNKNTSVASPDNASSTDKPDSREPSAPPVSELTDSSSTDVAGDVHDDTNTIGDIGEAHTNLLQSDNEGSSVGSSSESSSSSSSPESTENDKQKVVPAVDSSSSTANTNKNTTSSNNECPNKKTTKTPSAEKMICGVNNNNTDSNKSVLPASESSAATEKQEIESQEDEETRKMQLSELDGALPFLFCVEPETKNTLAQFFQQDSNIQFYFQMLVDSYYAYARNSPKIQSYLKRKYPDGQFAMSSHSFDEDDSQLDKEQEVEVEKENYLEVKETSQYSYQGFDELDYYYDNVIVHRDSKPYDQEFLPDDYDRRYIREKYNENQLDKATKQANSYLSVDVLAKMSDANNNLEQDEILLERCSTIADIYSSDTPKIVDALLANKSHLLLLWSILEKDFLYEMHPLLVSFVKINQSLLLNKADEYLNFIRSNVNLVDLFVKRNVDILLLNEFLMKLIITDKNNMHTGIIDLLMEQNLIQHMINLIDLRYPFYISEFVGDMIKSLIGISVSNLQQGSDETIAIGPNNLTRELVRHKSVWKMALKIKDGGKPASILIDIIIEIIRKNNCDYGNFNLLVFAKYKKFLDELQNGNDKQYTDIKGCEALNDMSDNANQQVETNGSDHSLENQRAEFNALMNQYPPSDREPIYLNNILKIFSLTVPWLCDALKENLGSYPEEYIFDSDKIDYFLLDKDPIQQLENNEIQSENDKKFLKDKVYMAQSFGYIERFTMFKLKLTELIAELLHCSNIKLYNHKDAQWLIESRNQLILSKSKFLNEAITDKLSLLNFDTSIHNNQEASLPIGSGIQSNNMAFIDDPTEEDEKDEHHISSSNSLKVVNNSDELVNESADENDKQLPDDKVANLTDEERKIKKDKMVSKLVLNINPEINTKAPAPQQLPLKSGKPELPKLDTSKSAISKVTDARNIVSREDNKENESRKPDEVGTSSNGAGALDDSFIFDDFDDFAAMGEFSSPFVCPANERMLTENPSLGDEFKYQLHQHKLLDLITKHICFRFPWNNFLHTVVYDIIQQLLSGTMTGNYNAFLVSDLFFMTNITDLLYSVAHKNENFLQKYNIEFACMGHVNLIADEIMRFISSYELDIIDPTIMDITSTDKWIEFSNQLLNVVKCNFEEEEDGNNDNDNDRDDDDDDIDDDDDEYDDDDDSIFRDPDSIILGATENEILNQDLKLSNPKKLDNLNQNNTHKEGDNADDPDAKEEVNGSSESKDKEGSQPKGKEEQSSSGKKDYKDEEFELPVYLKE